MGFVKSIKKAINSSAFDLFAARKFDDDAEDMVATLHPDAHEGGGLACNDKALLAEMRECIMQWIKSMGRQILQGNLNLVNSSFPVPMFEPRSYLQKMADVWAYPDLINASAQQEDPLERMKLLVAWLVAGLHRGLESWKKPFNPILGETWQAQMPGGVSLYMEQVSHHPPVSAYQLEGTSWSLSGWSQPAVVPVVRFYGIKTVAKGARRIEYADGSVVEVTTPHFAIKGVVYANKPHAEVLGVARLLDAKNRLEAVINFGPVPGTRRRILARADAVCGEIYQLPKAPHLLDASGTGGVLRRTGTAATPLPDLSASEGPVGSIISSYSHSEESNGDESAADEEAILDDFVATHFDSSASNGAAAIAPAGSIAQEQQEDMQQQSAGKSSKPRVRGSDSGSGTSGGIAGRFRRSKSSVHERAIPHPAAFEQHASGGGVQASVPGVAVARIEALVPHQPTLPTQPAPRRAPSLMDICYVAAASAVLGIAVLIWALKTPPQVPRQVSEWPSLGFLYLQLIRSALIHKRAPKDMKGKPIEVSLTVPARFDASRYAGFLKLVGYSGVPEQVPISYPFVESFRLSLLAMSHRDFPFNVLGAVLARNTSTIYRKLAADEALTYSVSIDPEYVRNAKSDTEIAIRCTAADASGTKVWQNSLTVIVLNPKRQRGGGPKPAEASESPKRELLAELILPANAGRAFGALTGDRNPIHMHALTSQLFGFKKPIAHAMYIVSRLEAELAKKGYTVKSYPAVFETEFKRPTTLPNKLQATVSPAAQPPLQCGVLTRDGGKEVIVGRLYST